MFCHKCGTKNTEGAAFCHKCGTKMAAGNAVPQAVNEPASNQISPTQTPVTPTDTDVSSLLAKLPAPEDANFRRYWVLSSQATGNKENCAKCNSGDVVPIALILELKSNNDKYPPDEHLLCKTCGHHYRRAGDEYKVGMVGFAILGILGLLLVPIGIWLGGIGGIVAIPLGIACLGAGVHFLLKAKKAKARMGAAPKAASPNKNSMGKLIGGAITIVIVVALVFGINALFSGGGGNHYIEMVRDGHFGAFPDITVGAAFNNVYENPRWSHFENTRGENIVRFTGLFRSSSVEWDFHVMRDTFDVVAIREDGIEYPLYWVDTWLTMVFMLQSHAIADDVTVPALNIGNPALIGTWDWNEHWPGVEGAIILHEDGRYSWQGVDYGALGYRWSSHMGVVYSTLNNVTTAWFSYQFITDDILLIFYVAEPGVGYRLDRAGAAVGQAEVSFDDALRIAQRFLDDHPLYSQERTITGVVEFERDGANFDTTGFYFIQLAHNDGSFRSMWVQRSTGEVYISPDGIILLPGVEALARMNYLSLETDTPQVTTPTDITSALLGTWLVAFHSWSDETWFAQDAFIDFFPDGTGVDTFDGSGRDSAENFNWEIVQRGDYYRLIISYNLGVVREYTIWEIPDIRLYLFEAAGPPIALERFGEF